MPRVGKTLFADDPLRSDLERAREPPTGYTGQDSFRGVVAITSGRKSTTALFARLHLGDHRSRTGSRCRVAVASREGTNEQTTWSTLDLGGTTPMADFGDSTPVVVSGTHSEALKRETAHGHDERWLQSLIHQHPMCLPMGEIEPAFVGVLPVCMELPVCKGWVDNLLMTPDGNIVIVEVKLWQNPEARRAVVAQALEYATGLFRMTYDDLQSAVMRADFGDGDRPTKLYDLFRGCPDALAEDAFVDAVSRNLEMGRIVVLIAGDGIRQDAEDLVAGLQAHANFHFTFALVEMPVFRRETETDQTDQLIVVPRTLLKTTMVERFTIRVCKAIKWKSMT